MDTPIPPDYHWFYSFYIEDGYVTLNESFSVSVLVNSYLFKHEKKNHFVGMPSLLCL